MDYIKEAFQKVKEDIDSLRQNIQEIKEKVEELVSKTTPTHPTDNLENPTNKQNIPTDNSPLKGLKAQNMGFSTGNEGVPTNKQTNKQTNQQINNRQFQGENSLDNALEVLNSLDSIKKDIRLRFKRLTEQEFLVFSTIYQLDEELGGCDYKAVSDKLNLSETSIRDYVRKLIKKGISVEKIKINNKNIQLKISEKLKKIATLPVILRLREL